MFETIRLPSTHADTIGGSAEPAAATADGRNGSDREIALVGRFGVSPMARLAAYSVIHIGTSRTVVDGLPTFERAVWCALMLQSAPDAWWQGELNAVDDEARATYIATTVENVLFLDGEPMTLVSEAGNTSPESHPVSMRDDPAFHAFAVDHITLYGRCNQSIQATVLKRGAITVFYCPNNAAFGLYVGAWNAVATTRHHWPSTVRRALLALEQQATVWKFDQQLPQDRIDTLLPAIRKACDDAYGDATRMLNPRRCFEPVPVAVASETRPVAHMLHGFNNPSMHDHRFVHESLDRLRKPLAGFQGCSMSLRGGNGFESPSATEGKFYLELEAPSGKSACLVLLFGQQEDGAPVYEPLTQCRSSEPTRFSAHMAVGCFDEAWAFLCELGKQHHATRLEVVYGF